MICVPFLDLAGINLRFQQDFADALARVVRSGWVLRGTETAAFEREFGAWNGSRNCVCVASGYDALQLTLRAWMSLGRLEQGDEVIVPANSFIASALAVTKAQTPSASCRRGPRHVQCLCRFHWRRNHPSYTPRYGSSLVQERLPKSTPPPFAGCAMRRAYFCWKTLLKHAGPASGRRQLGRSVPPARSALPGQESRRTGRRGLCRH